MKTGIAITTTPNRADKLKECLFAIKQLTVGEAIIYVHHDDEYKGVAYSKNMCLRKLFEIEKCDHVFLFDDDCYPIKKGWNVNVSSKHTLLLNNKLHQKIGTLISGHFKYEAFKESGGVFMSICRKDWENIGYFDSRYIGYGFEHAGYSQRIYKTGTIPTPYMMQKGMDKFLFAHDYSGVHIESSLTGEQKKANIEHNMKIFLEEKNSTTNFYKSFTP